MGMCSIILQNNEFKIVQIFQKREEILVKQRASKNSCKAGFMLGLGDSIESLRERRKN